MRSESPHLYKVRTSYRQMQIIDNLKGEIRISEILALVVMIAVLIGGSYFVWLNFPTNLEYNSYVSNATAHLPGQSYQFYPNMRYVNRTIAYKIAPECSSSKRANIAAAFDILEEETVLRFISTEGTGQLVYFCTSL